MNPFKMLALLAALALPAAFPTGPAPAAPQTPRLWLPVVHSPAGKSNPLHTGIATYYNADGNGACLFGASPADLMVTALNGAEWDTAAWCGAFVQVWGPKGTITVRIVDLCPECQAGHLDLSKEAFAEIADVPLGRVDITWQVVSPAISGPIVYHWKDGTNPWWAAVQVRNHRNPVAKFEVNLNGAWQALPRTDYNYFIFTNGGAGPFSFRVTDLYGNVLTDSGIPMAAETTVNGAGQFPYGP